MAIKLRANNSTQTLTPTPNSLPHRTTRHPFRGMSVSVRLDGALTWVGHVRWVSLLENSICISSLKCSWVLFGALG